MHPVSRILAVQKAQHGTKLRTAAEHQAHPPPQAQRGTGEAVGGRMQRLVLPMLYHLRLINGILVLVDILKMR
jgi:hypothetical protein